MWKQAQLEQWQKDNPNASREINHANMNGQVAKVQEEEEEEEEYSGSGSEFYTDDSEEEDDDDDEYAPLEIAAWGNQATTADSAPVQLSWDSLIDPNVKVPTNGLGSGNLHRRGGNFIPVSEEMIIQQRKGKPIPGSGKKKKKRKPKAKSGAPKPPKPSKPIKRAPYVPSMPESSTIAKIANRDRAPITTGAWANAQLSSEAFWEAKSNTGTSASKYAPQQSNNPPPSSAPVRPPGLPVPSSQQAGGQWGQQSQPMPSQWGQQQPQRPPVQVNAPQQQQANGQWGQQQPQKATTQPQQQQIPAQWGQQQASIQSQPQQQQQIPTQWGQQSQQQVPAQANKPQDPKIPTQWGQQTQPQVSSQAPPSSSQWNTSQLNPTATPWGQQPQQPQSQLSPTATPWVQHTQQQTSSPLNPAAAPWGQQQPPEWNKPFQPPINIQVQPAPSRDVFDFSPHGSAASKYAPFSVKKAAEAAAQQLELQKKQQEYKQQQQQSSSQQGAPKALVADFNIEITYGVSARLMVWENDDPLTVVEQFAKRCKLNIEGEGKRSFIEKVKKLLEEHELKKQQQ